LQYRQVVASFLRSGEEILLLRRSGRVGSYQGKWAGVSGFLEQGEIPLQRAKLEILEEVGLNTEDIRLVRSGEPLRAFDEQEDTVWTIFPFLFDVQQRSVRLDWEHSEHKWINADGLRSHETVPKLNEGFERVRWDLSYVPPALPEMETAIIALSRDRLHGASFLGRRAVEILAKVASVSTAESNAELFRDLLSFTLKLRKAQPSMATLRNLTGMVLKEADAARYDFTSVGEYRKAVISSAERVLDNSIRAAEDASRNCVSILSDQGHVLTHSYSSTVKRALELATKSRHKLTVFATESSPGLEGKRLANDLVTLGIPVRLTADSTVHSIVANVDLVLVGADSILADGSTVNKIGTAHIAKAAREIGVPLTVVCETAKFSTQDFLGEPVDISKELFDVTASECVATMVTEEGQLEPKQVEGRIGAMLSQVYP
jgi:translation initiation factor 2B subunit (eIF-2B alpha/beta/delta family)/ADP-ribose pyrophosphatase YjhB (NUDIX family)